MEDGYEKVSANNPDTFGLANQNLSIGRSMSGGAPAANPFIGNTDNFAIVQRKLTDEEMETYFCCGGVPDDKYMHIPQTDYLNAYFTDIVSGIKGNVGNYDESILWGE